MFFYKSKKKNAGFSLIELILVLGISSMAFMGFLQYENKRAQILRGEIAGEQIKEVGEALEAYVMRNAGTLQTVIPINTTSAAIPVTVLQGTASPPYPGTRILDASFANRNIIGGQYLIRIRNDNGVLVGLATTQNAIADLAGVRYDLAGAAMKKAGSKSGVAFLVSNQISGYDGAWNLTSANYPNITTAGQLAYRSQSINSSTFDNVYLRLDGAFPMAGNLNMGNFNINNVTDINLHGWLNANNILVNNLRAGAITNNGNLTNLGVIDSTGQVIARNSVETSFINRNNTLGNRDVTVGDGGAVATNQGNIKVRDIFLRGGAGAGARSINGGNGLWLSDLLPRYTSRGIVLIGDGSAVNKPTCPVGGMAGAKIEIIPQLQWIQSEIGGFINFGTQTTDLWGLGNSMAYAVNNATTWTVYVRTLNRGAGAGFTSGIGLAHIYCDNQF